MRIDSEIAHASQTGQQEACRCAVNSTRTKSRAWEKREKADRRSDVEANREDRERKRGRRMQQWNNGVLTRDGG
eukprot:983742-Rhodomonas_salina.1